MIKILIGALIAASSILYLVGSYCIGAGFYYSNTPTEYTAFTIYTIIYFLVFISLGYIYYLIWNNINPPSMVKKERDD